MLQFNDTKLEIFGFGDNKEDIFYCLINLKVNPDGLDVDKLAKTDPRELDDQLDKMGCLVMITGEDLESLISEEDLSEPNMHQALYDLAVKEEVIK